MRYWKKYSVIILTLLLVTLGTGIFTFYISVYPKIKDIHKYEPLLKKIVLEKTGLPIEIKNLNGNLSWDLSYNARADRVELKKNDGSEFVSGDALKVKIFIPSLLFKKIRITKMESSNFHANITRLDNGEIDLIKIFKTCGAKTYCFKFVNTKIIANNYRINFQDLYVKPNQKIILEGEKLYVDRFTASKFISLKSSGKYTINNKTNLFDLSLSSKIPFDKKDFSITGKTKNLNFQDFSPYFKKSLPDFKKINGTADIKFNIENAKNFDIEAVVNNFSYIDLKRGKIFEFPEHVFFDFSGIKEENSLTFIKSVAKSKDFKLQLDGSISNLHNKKKTLDLSIITDKSSRIESLIKLSPNDLKVKDYIVKKLKKYKIKGNIETNIVLKANHKKPLIYGTIKVDNVTSMDEIIPEKSFGKLEMKGKKFYINSKLFIEKEKSVLVSGFTSPYYGKKCDLKITTSKNLNLDLAHKKLLALHDMIGFKITPVEDMKFSGKGDLILFIKGKFKTPKITGKINFLNARLSYKTLSKPIDNAFGSITFKGDRLFYDDLKGKMEGSNLVVSGYTTLKGYSDANIYAPDANLVTVMELINNSHLLESAKKSLVIIEKANGRGEIKLNLKGESDNIVTTGKLTVKDSFLKLKDISMPVNHVKGLILFDYKKVDFSNKLTGTMAKSPIVLTGKIENKFSDLLITSSKMDTLAVYQMINTSPALIGAKKSLKDYSNPTGYTESKL
ncbi:MAG: hypothetical protein WC197_02400, partial [Candidatus Gastranaerophilaceae bacterium]